MLDCGCGLSAGTFLVERVRPEMGAKRTKSGPRPHDPSPRTPFVELAAVTNARSCGQGIGLLSATQGLKTRDESIMHLLTQQRGEGSLMRSGEGVQPREFPLSERGQVH